MANHSEYRFSITIHSDDLAVVHCLRALSQFSQRTDNNRIPWGNTKESDWQANNHKVTFRFTSPEYRKVFASEISRLILINTWTEISRSDDDPAKPASR